jgi:hypothetical protein
MKGDNTPDYLLKNKEISSSEFENKESNSGISAINENNSAESNTYGYELSINPFKKTKKRNSFNFIKMNSIESPLVQKSCVNTMRNEIVTSIVINNFFNDTQKNYENEIPSKNNRLRSNKRVKFKSNFIDYVDIESYKIYNLKMCFSDLVDELLLADQKKKDLCKEVCTYINLKCSIF